MIFVCSVPSGAEGWVPPRKSRVLTQAESELQGGHIAIALEKLLCHLHCLQNRDTKSFPRQLPGGNRGEWSV